MTLDPRTSDLRSPADVDRAFGERVNAGDLDGLVALYEPGATLAREDGSSVTGAAAIRAELAGLLAGKPRIAMHVVHVIPGGDDVALLHNDWHLTAVAPDGARVDVSGRSSEVVRRQPDGTWRFAVDDPFARSRG
jgi:uncharacterized protein (TIGR02246 family)